MTLLEAREERSILLKELYNSYKKPLVIVKGNVVGIDKNPSFMMFVLQFFNHKIEEQYMNSIVYQESIESIDGNYKVFVINKNADELKSSAIVLEESDIGRLVDIDIYQDKTFTRSDFNKPLRTCFICDKPAFVCARSKAHTQKEILTTMQDTSKIFLENYLFEITDQAIKSEIELYPSFGLVSKVDSGSHSDMDYHTFIKSKDALRNGIKAYINTSFNKEINDEELITIGLNMEKDMFKATNNINTHKGLIFLLGIFLPIVGHSIYYNTLNDIQSKISALSTKIVSDYYQTITTKKHVSHSDTIYLEYGIKGIREEGLNGLQKVFANPFKEKDSHATLMNDLLYFMSILNDTTIIHKKDISVLKQVKTDAKEILRNGGYESNVEKVLHLSNTYKGESISPGGSADMLVIMTIYRQIRYLINS